MVPAPSATTVAVVVVGVISVTLVGYILLRRRKNGTATGQGDDATSSPNAKSTSPSPSPIPSTQTSGVHAPIDAPRPQHSQTPDQQPCLDDKTLSDVATGLGCDWVKLAVELGSTMVQVETIERNREKDITRQGLKMLVTWKQAQSTSVEQQITTLCAALRKIGRADIAGFLNDSPQGTGAIKTIDGVDDSNKPTVDGSGQVKRADGGDDTTSSPNAKSISRSPSTIPSAQASGTGATETNQRVNGSKKPTVDASDKIKSAGLIAATGQGDDATPSPNAKSTSRSPSPIPPTQASAATGQGDVVTSSPSTKPTSPSPSPIPSAQASDSSQQTETIGNSGTVSGSHNPNIVRSSGVDYCIPLEEPGVPAPRPQHSQRPDQELRQRTPSYQEVEPRLDDKTLLEVVKRLCGDWVTLAVELGSTMVQTIERNYPRDVTRQGLEMLETWKCAQATSDEQQRTTLCTALEKIGRADIAGFLHGVPAPRPQQSQRPDQEPRLRAPSFQDVGNKTRDILKERYKTTGSYVQLLPGVENDHMHIAGIYTKVQLETREGVAVTGQKGETVNSTEYAKIFKLRTRVGELIKRLIFLGIGGVGKSTIFDKIAFDWADETSEILNGFKLVFLLKMCALSQEYDLVDSTFDQLLGEDSGIERDKLHKFILANPTEVLILLDGFDEMKTKKLNAAYFGSILKALNRTAYKECLICISTRPSHLEILMSKTLVQYPCTHIEVLGFSDEDVNEYVQKFFDKDPDSGNTLIQTIGKSNTLREFAKTPMLLLLMCLLWRENMQLPETISRFFTRALDYMFTRKNISGEDGSKIVISIGKTALCGLMSANQEFSFQEDEIEPIALDLALKAGILTKQSVIKNSKSDKNIQFMHKTMQEYCAAKYLQSVHRKNQGFFKRKVFKVVPIGEFQNSLMQLCQTIEGVVSNEFLLCFCCGDNEKCMTDIVNLLDRNFSKDKPRYQSHVIQAISRNCFFESQSRNVPRCLTSDSHIPSNIEVRNNHEFRSLIYLLEIICRSDSRAAQLARVETIQVSSVSSVSDVAFALGHMENLRALRLDKCPLETGDLEKTLSSLKCNHLTSLDIVDCDTLGGTAIEWAPHIKHLTSLNKLEVNDCGLQLTDIEHIASAVRDMPKLTELYLHGHRLGGLQSLFPSHIKVHSS